MILGFFDSGLGGKVVMKEFKKLYPEIEMRLFMDRENAPYGGKTGEEIRILTKRGVDILFEQGADVVILACNTASVHALRWLQQEVYPGRYILGVTVPGAEAVVEGGYKKIGVLATEATVRSRMYKERVHIFDDSVIVEEIGAPGLVPLIEKGVTSGPEIEILLEKYLSQLSPDIEALVLGCTHYPIIRESIEKVWSELIGAILPLTRGSQRGLEKIGFQKRFSKGDISVNFGYISYNPELKDYARENRKSGNIIQEGVWSLLRGKKLGYKFHREKPIGDYIVDFYSSDLKFAIEIDGESHLDNSSRDTVRTKFLNSLGIHVLRYTNGEVREMLENVREDILYWISYILQPTLALPCQGGDRTLRIIDPGKEAAKKMGEWMNRKKKYYSRL